VSTPLRTLKEIDYNGRLDQHLRLWTQDGFSTREIAARLDVSHTTAWRWVSHATGRMNTVREEQDEQFIR
jgi:transposase